MIRLSDPGDPVTVTLHEDGDRVVSDWQQPGWDKLLEHIKALKQERVVEDLSFGRWELEIPLGILHFLKKAYPELASLDGETKRKAWIRFANSRLSEPFRVHGRGRFIGRSAGGLDNGGQGLRADSRSGSGNSNPENHGGASGEGLRGGEGPDSLSIQPPYFGDP